MPNETAASAFSGGRFRRFAQEKLADLTPAPDRAAGFSEPLRISAVLSRAVCAQAFPTIPRDWTSAFSGFKDEGYLALFRKVDRSATADPEYVILLEIEPEKQKTRIDFACTKSAPRRMAGLPDENQETRPADCSTNAMDAKCESSGSTTASFSMSCSAGRMLKPGFDFQDELDVTVGRPPQLVFPDQQTFPAVPENGAYFAGLFCRRISV